MVELTLSMKIAIASAVIFLIVGYRNTYDITRKILGKLVKQGDLTYGQGETVSNRGFLLHALVAGLLMFLVLKYGLKLD